MLADRYYAAFNARDLDAWLETLAEDVQIVVDAGALCGRVAALAYLNGILQAYPGVVVASRRVVAMSGDAVVSEFRLHNPMAIPAAPAASAAPWRLDGVTCEVLRLRGDRLISLHSYYSPTPTDRTPTAEVPSRAEAARIAHRQAALGQVATQVAGGGSEQDLVAVVNQVIAGFTGVDVSLILRFETGDTAVVLSASGLVDDPAAVGRRLILAADILAVRNGGRALRFGAHGWPLREPDDGSAAPEDLQWCLGVPITLHGAVWGLSLLGSAHDEPFADDLAEGITAFTQLVSTALANAQANDELRERAREQSELLEVAEIAARGAATPEVFTAIARAASVVLESAPTTLIRFVDADAADVLACHGFATTNPLTGTRIRLDQDSLAAQVKHTNASARIDHYPASVQGQSALQAGFRASVGVPVTVGGRPWGMLSAGSTDGPLPSTTEHRLSVVAGTGAAAIAGAQARSELLALAEKQAALRRVAELAAHDAPADEVLHVVAKEASVFAGVEFAMVLRYEGTDGGNQIVALYGAPDNFVVGMCAPGTGDGAVHRVWRTGRAARVENLDQMGGLWPAMASARGFTTSAGVPIVIRGVLWGALIVAGGQDFPATIEVELTHFAELAGTAVSSTDARQQLRALADEQAALRRVAELAAHEAPAGQVLGAVAVETSALAGVDFSTLLRYEPDGSTLIVALDGAPEGVTVGMRAPRAGDGAVQRVWRTRRAARIDNLAEMSGSWPQLAHRHGFNASVAVPIVMHGGLWGALVAVGRGEAFTRAVEEHVSNFAELAGAAVSAADAREELKLLANEQAAVRRVAELVARGATLDEIFDAVATETSSLLENLPTSLLHYAEGDGAVVVAGNHLTPAELRYRVASDNDPLGEVRLTGGSVRVDHVHPVLAPDASSGPDLGIGIALPVAVEGHVWGALTVSTPGPPVPAGTEERLTPFAELVAVAIANTDNKAKLTASRARVIATADETRRRVQRDVHDGAQQRLVHTIIALKLARDALLAGEPSTELLDEALTNAERASKELRDIVRGILPASLTRGGLRNGLESLLAGLALPVTLQVDTPRLTAHAETTAYFIVAEAITNVVKHARANRGRVHVSINGQTLFIEVRDDGIGGADAKGGTGLTGLRDRVEAANGTLIITSPPGAGTLIAATLPLDDQPPPGPPRT